MKTARPDQAGMFELRLVAAADYLIAALEYVEDGDWNGPEYLKGLIDRATRITLEDRGTMQVDLTLRK